MDNTEAIDKHLPGRERSAYEQGQKANLEGKPFDDTRHEEWKRGWQAARRQVEQEIAGEGEDPLQP